MKCLYSTLPTYLTLDRDEDGKLRRERGGKGKSDLPQGELLMWKERTASGSLLPNCDRLPYLTLHCPSKAR